MFQVLVRAMKICKVKVALKTLLSAAPSSPPFRPPIIPVNTLTISISPTHSTTNSYLSVPRHEQAKLPSQHALENTTTSRCIFLLLDQLLHTTTTVPTFLLGYTLFIHQVRHSQQTQHLCCPFPSTTTSYLASLKEWEKLLSSSALYHLSPVLSLVTSSLLTVLCSSFSRVFSIMIRSILIALITY